MNNETTHVLNMIKKGKKFQYQVVELSTGNIISKRESSREYVACTINGAFYFGRIDLIGKGDHGKSVAHAISQGKTPAPIAHLIRP